MHRRSFLISATGAALAPQLAWATQRFDLTAQPVNASLLPDGGPLTAMLGFNGATPGPELRFRQGEVRDIRFLNHLDQASAVHWHGLRQDNAMDGVPGLTQDVVPPGDSFDYAVRTPDAGTYWYHSHNRSSEQVAKGLFGPLIVVEDTPPDVDHDITVLIDDWRLTDTGALAEGFDDRHDQAHGGRLGNFARALFGMDGPVRVGDRLRLRLINVATDRIFPIEIAGIDGMIVALDGMPLATPRAVGELVLAPAQRMDIIADVTSDQQIDVLFPTRDGPFALGALPVNGVNADRTPAPIRALPANQIAAPDLTHAVAVTLVMQGGAMSRQMMSQSDIWAFNGQSGLPDAPLHSFERGQTARITMVNDTRFAHGIHLHGHHFHEIAANGALGDLRDTTLVDAGASQDILCVFDNPGKWLLHCHMLGHQASGMKTWVEVT